MILRIKNKANGSLVTPVTGLVEIKSGSDNISVTPNDDGIVFSDSREDYNEWYATMLERKRVAMHIGGSITSVADFVIGIKVYTHTNGTPYLLAINGCNAGDKGNIQLLPGKTLDVYVQDGVVMCAQIEIPRGASKRKMLEDINRFLWYLYHTFNSFLYRMNVWDPSKMCGPMYTNARMLGVIQSYQAAVAAWNLKIWRNSFIWEVAQSIESITFHIGYVALNCINPDIECFVILSNPATEHRYASEGNDEAGRPKLDVSQLNKTEFYTLYQQGAASNIDDINATIRKVLPGGTNDGSNEVTVSGKGTDTAAERGQHWNSITVKVPLSNLTQGMYYRGAFTLAIAQNSTTAKYYESINQSARHYIGISAQWLVKGEVAHEVVTETYYIPELVLYTPKEGEDEDSFI